MEFRLVQMMTDDISRANLRLELSLVVIVAAPLVKATYNLEGDGPCSLIAYKQLLNCKVWFETHLQHLTFPYLLEEIENAVQVLSPLQFNNDDVLARESLKTRVRSAIEPAWSYFRNKVFGDLGPDIAIYATLRYCNPFSIKRMNYRVNLIELRGGIEALGHFTALDVNRILSEFPTYILLCEQFNDIPEAVADELQLILKFWKLNMLPLPAMALFVRYAYCITPSSASVERVFSLLKSSFGSQQNLALEDYIKASLMFQYNNR